MIDRKTFLTICMGFVLTGSLTACTGIAADRKAKTTDATAATDAEDEEVATEELEGTTLTVATTTDPYAAILKDFATGQLADLSMTLKVKSYKSIEEANAAVASGKADASFCMRRNQLDPYTGDGLPELSNAGSIFYQPYGVFSAKHDSLHEMQQSATIAIPNDDIKRGRALLLLQQEGIIALNEPKRLDAHTYDLAENALQIQWRDTEPSQLAAVLGEVDYAVFDPSDVDEPTDAEDKAGDSGDSGDKASASHATLDASDAIVVEASDGTAAKRYAGIVAVDPDKAEDPGVKALVHALKSEEFDHYLQRAYGQDLIPIT